MGKCECVCVFTIDPGYYNIVGAEIKSLIQSGNQYITNEYNPFASGWGIKIVS